jgi:signal transduction histidine kinase
VISVKCLSAVDVSHDVAVQITVRDNGIGIS